MDTRIENRPLTKVAAIRHVGPYDQSGPAWEKLFNWSIANKLDTEEATWLGLYYDDPRLVAAEQLKSDLCIVIEDDIKETDEIKQLEIAAGEYLVGLHRGSYKNLYESYNHLYKTKLGELGRKCKELPAIEVYLNCPTCTPEDELLTEIWVPME